jgi:hypothetical protein
MVNIMSVHRILIVLVHGHYDQIVKNISYNSFFYLNSKILTTNHIYIN